MTDTMTIEEHVLSIIPAMNQFIKPVNVTLSNMCCFYVKLQSITFVQQLQQTMLHRSIVSTECALSCRPVMTH